MSVEPGMAVSQQRLVSPTSSFTLIPPLGPWLDLRLCGTYYVQLQRLLTSALKLDGNSVFLSSHHHLFQSLVWADTSWPLFESLSQASQVAFFEIQYCTPTSTTDSPETISPLRSIAGCIPQAENGWDGWKGIGLGCNPPVQIQVWGNF